MTRPTIVKSSGVSEIAYFFSAKAYSETSDGREPFLVLNPRNEYSRNAFEG
jgi:hypothetical protein